MSITQEAKKEVQQLIRSGQRTKAIKYLMDTFQVSMEDARSLVEAVESESKGSMFSPSPTRDALTGNLKQEVEQLLSTNKKIEAIRQVRVHKGVSLKQARDLVEEVEKEINPTFVPATSRGCASNTLKVISIFFYIVSFMLLGGAGLVYYNEKESIENSDMVIGTVISLEANTDGDEAETVAPVVSYTWNGEERLYQSSMYSYPPAYEVGEKVELFVNRDSPDKVYINSFSERWLAIVILAGVGTFFLIFAVIMNVVSRKVK